jgi:cytochrome P450
VARSLDELDGHRVAQESERWAGALAADLDLASFPFHLSVYVLGSLLGVPATALPEVARWTEELVGAFASTSNPEQVERGKAAAGHLLDLFRPLRQASGAPDGILAALGRHGARGGHDDAAILANGIGLLSQAYEATAGLMGNTLLALAAHRPVRTRVTADPGLLAHVVQEALRFDPPVQNTRRFLARTGIVAGQAMKENDTILIVLAAANRDPSANPDPHRFDIFRKDRRIFTFGAGLHACPGQSLATTIATAGVAQLLRDGIDLERLAATVTYRPSVNTRIPRLA